MKSIFDIKENINLYIKLVEDKGFPIQEAYLYGSYANGTPNECNDIDLAIISEKFEGNRILDREKILGLYIDIRLSQLPLNPSSFIDSTFVQSEVVKKGIKII